MALNSDTITVLVIVVVAFAAIRLLEQKLGHRVGEEADPAHYEEKIAELQRQMAEQKERYEQRIRELERRIDFLVGELQRAGIRIRDLESEHGAPVVAAPKIDSLPVKPLVLVVGDYAAAGDVDRQAIRRANIPFHRLLNASKNDVVSFLRGQRQNGTLPPWMHISAHAGPEGVALVDGIADPAWWHEQVQGMSVVFLAACKTAKVAEALAGLVTVVFVYEDIDNQAASDFTYAFWRRMHEHNDPVKAYRQAVIEAPSVAEFTDIRTG